MCRETRRARRGGAVELITDPRDGAASATQTHSARRRPRAMASAYQKEFVMPEEFPATLRDFTREVLRDQGFMEGFGIDVKKWTTSSTQLALHLGSEHPRVLGVDLLIGPHDAVQSLEPPAPEAEEQGPIRRGCDQTRFPSLPCSDALASSRRAWPLDEHSTL